MDSYRIREIIPILIVLFLSYLGFALALPIFPPMFLSTSKEAIISATLSPEMRTVFLGLLISMYPLGQLFGGPILGKLSDCYGRKPILIITLIAIIPGYLLSAFAILWKNLPLLYISRLICGLCEGNSVIAAAAMADISQTKQEKAQKFGLILTVSSLGFIFGPFIGGKLSDSQAIHWFNYSTPFLMAAGLVLIGLCFVFFMFKETLQKGKREIFHFRGTIQSIFTSILSPRLRHIFLSNFFLFLSIFSFFGFFPVLLVWWYQYNAAHIGEVISYLSIPICLSPLLFSFLSKHMMPRNITILFATILMASILSLFGAQKPIYLYFFLIPIGLCIAVSWTYSSLIISDHVSPQKQGEALGTNQSITIFAEIIAGMVGGMMAGVEMFLPLILAAAAALTAALWLFFFVPNDTHYEAPSSK
ncbi:MAG: MFS transporter [Simkaniaceae bacterium]|nr:MFS transporter [Simkaniaceae bacterium]MCF7851736.1 MFS transporter [Simkaniaceae bacterium]